MLHPSKSEEVNEEESYPLVEGASDGVRVKSSRYCSSQQPNIWILTTFILAFLLLAIGIRDYVQSGRTFSRQYGYETGFETDWSKFLQPLAYIHTYLGLYWIAEGDDQKVTKNRISSSCSRSDRLEKGQILWRHLLRRRWEQVCNR